MNINLEQYRKYRRVAGKDEKDGIWNVTRFPNGRYCFATQQWLGDNDEHPLLNKKFKRKKDGKTYILDSVCIHWYMGYYYHASIVKMNKSQYELCE